MSQVDAGSGRRSDEQASASFDELRGIITVLNTPFTDQNTIDVTGLRRNVAAAVGAGVAGFLVPALASEVAWLTAAERLLLVREVIDAAAGRAVVIGGAAADSQPARLQRAAELIALGCDGILVPVDSREDRRTALAELQEIAALQPGFLMLQEWDAEGAGLPVATIVEWFQHVGPFRWLKIEVQQAAAKYTRVLQATDGRLRVAGGWAVTEMIDGLQRGVHAFMPTAMHPIYVEIDRRFRNGDVESASTLFEQLRPVLAFSNQQLDVSICFFKRLLYRQGIYATPRVRIAASGWNAALESAADRLIERVIEMESRLVEP